MIGGVIHQTRFCIGNHQLLCSHTDLLRELCVIQTTVLINSGDRHVYCPRRSRFRPPINTTLLTSSCLHSHLHPPLARPLSLSNLCHGAAGLPMRRRGVATPRGRSLEEQRRGHVRATGRGCARPPNFGLVLGPVQSLSLEVAAAG